MAVIPRFSSFTSLWVLAAVLTLAVSGCSSSSDEGKGAPPEAPSPAETTGSWAPPEPEIVVPEEPLAVPPVELAPQTPPAALATTPETQKVPQPIQQDPPSLQAPSEAETAPKRPWQPEPLGEAGHRGNPLRPGPPPGEVVAPAPRAASPARETTPVAPARHSPPSLPSNEQGHGQGKHEEPFDPVKENGPIFVDWPKPKLALVITGRQDGYLEPCGCAGLDRMKGGLSRRHSMIEQLRDKQGWPLLAVDVGGLAKGFGLQAEIKFSISVDAMKTMGYDAIAFGKNDLRLPAAGLVSLAAGSEEKPGPFIAANVGLFGMDSGVTEPYRIAEAAGIKVGIVAILGKEYQREINNPDIEFVDPEAALAKIVPKLREQCPLMILLAHATKAETLALAKRFPEFNIVVTSDGAPEPPAKPAMVEETGTLLIEVGEKGMNAIVLGLYDDAKTPFRYQRVPLDSRFPGLPPMKMLMVAYQEQLRELGLSGLGIREKTHPMSQLNGDFVGSQKCGNCHEASYDVWKKTGHARAWKTLVEDDPPRHHDPECISCHVVGWHPNEYFPYKTGFLSEKKTPELVDVGCESCHGPGGAHVRAEMGSDAALQKKLQQAMVVTLAEARKAKDKMCYNCHDLDNSPDFDFDTYWPKVEHREDE